jgi:hypothetical protein
MTVVSIAAKLRGGFGVRLVLMKGKLGFVVALGCLSGSLMGQPELSEAKLRSLDLVKRGAAVTVKVESYADAQKGLADLVAKHGGTAADRHRVASEKGRHSGWLRVQVPKANLDAFLGDVRQLGKVYGERLSLEDRSEEYLSLGKRAERLRQHEARLSGILGSGRRLRGSDILYVQERLFRASVDEDSLLQQREALAARTPTSSVVVTFFEPTRLKEEPRGFIGHAKAAFEDGLRNLALTGLGLIGSLMHLLVYAIIAWVLWLLFRRPLLRVWERLRAWTEPAPAKAPTPAAPAE